MPLFRRAQPPSSGRRATAKASVDGLPPDTLLELTPAGRRYLRASQPRAWTAEELRGPWVLRASPGTSWGTNLIRPQGSKRGGIYVEGQHLQPAASVRAEQKERKATQRRPASPGALEAATDWNNPATIRKEDDHYRLVHSSGLHLRIDKLGKGHASEVFLGEDGWVYAFERESARDPAKEVLWSVWKAKHLKHLPVIEAIGPVTWVGGFGKRIHGNGYRMPRYHPLRAAEHPVAFAQAKLLRACNDDAGRVLTRHGLRAFP